MRWPKYWSFSFSISLSKEHPGLISSRMDWLNLLAVQGLLQHHRSTLGEHKYKMSEEKKTQKVQNPFFLGFCVWDFSLTAFQHSLLLLTYLPTKTS